MWSSISSSSALGPFKDNFSTNKRWKLHKHLAAFKKLNSCLKSTNVSQNLNYLTWIKDLAVSSQLLLTFMHTGITSSAMMLVFWQSLCSPLCVLVSTCFKLLRFFSASRAEPCLFHTLKAEGKEQFPGRLSTGKKIGFAVHPTGHTSMARQTVSLGLCSSSLYCLQPVLQELSQ